MVEGKLIDNLIKALQYEYKTYSEILKLAEKKTHCLIKNDIETLVSITEEEKKAAEQTVKLNQVREQLLLKICEELQLDYKTLNVDKLMEHVEKPHQLMLEEMRTKLNQVISKLAEQNTYNKKLIENALEAVNFNIQILSSPQPSVPIYGRTGQEVTQNTKRSMFDLKY